MLLLALAGDQAATVSTLIHNFNWRSPSWDLFILLGWVVVSVVYSFAAGRGRVVNILMSIFISKLLVAEAPFLSDGLNKKLNLSLISLQHLAAFVGLFLILFMLMGRFVFRTSADNRSPVSMFFSVIFSFLQIGLLINIILTFLPAGTQQNFSPLIQLLFIKQPASFVWLIAPVLYLIILGKFVGDTAEI
jgi:hypothetical protein